MTVDAVFEHEDGVKYNEVFESSKQFLKAVRSRKTCKLIHAVDYNNHFIIYPSNIPEYRAMYP